MELGLGTKGKTTTVLNFPDAPGSVPGPSQSGGHRFKPSGPAFLLVLGPARHESFLRLASDDHDYLIGRLESEADLLLEDQAVSGRHARLVTRAERAFLLDNPSRNGTYVNDEAVDTAGVELEDGDIIRAGGTEILFGGYDSRYQSLLQRLAFDGRTGLPNLEAFEADAHRLTRQGEPFGLFGVDVDNFKALLAREGSLVADALLRELATIFTSHFPQNPRYCIADDGLVVIIKDSDASEAVVAAAYHHLASHLREYNLTASAAYVRSHDVASHRGGALARLEEKLLQAKMAGGGRLFRASVFPFWCRTDTSKFEHWLATRRDSSCVVVRPSRQSALQVAAAADGVRQWIADALETLPASTEVAVVWTQDSHFLVGASCAKDILERHIATSPSVTIESRGRDRSFVSRILSGRAERSIRPEISQAFAQCLAPLHAAPESAYWSTSIVAFEKALQAAAAFLLSAVSHFLHESMLVMQDEHSSRADAISELVRQNESLLTMLGKRIVGEPRTERTAGSWIKPILIMANYLKPRLTSAPSLRRLDKRWEKAVYRALGERNSVHESPTPADQKRGAAFLCKQIQILAEVFTQEEWEFLRIDAVERIRYRAGASRVYYRRLGEVMLGDLPSEETDQVVTQGSWVRVGERWILTSPLIDFDYCEASARQLVFVAAGLPSTYGDVKRIAVGQRSQSEVLVSNEHVELKLLIEAVAVARQLSPSQATVITTRQDLGLP